MQHWRVLPPARCLALSLPTPCPTPCRHSTFKQDYELPPNVNATTSAAEALAGAQFAIHAVPVQHTRAFLQGIKVGSILCLCAVTVAPTQPIITI